VSLEASSYHDTVRLMFAERLAFGRGQRVRVPRSSHASWSPDADRPDPIDLIESTNHGRRPEYVPVRWGRMAASPFAFLRGAAVVMADDLARTPVTGLGVQASGDAHLLNFGVFGSQERNIVFGLNDFDETLPGPWEWDVRRLTASCVAAGRFVGAREADARAIARSAVRTYRERIGEFAEMGAIEIWYHRLDGLTVLPVLSPGAQRRARDMASKATRRTNLQVLARMSELVDSNLRLVDNPPLVVRVADDPDAPLEAVMQAWLRAYRASLDSDRRALLDRYRAIDAVRKVVGVGSVGTHCYVVLLVGHSTDDPLFLQVKEATASVLERYLGPSRYRNHGRRVVLGQRYLQPGSDIFLGWGEGSLLDGSRVQFYVRQLRDMKGGAILAEGETVVSNLAEYAGVCGWGLALAHARSGDPAMISGYLGRSEQFDDAMVRWAAAYADQTERDHERLLAAIKSGRVAAELGV
jgi:uncharacterized protein (DUF2252 family)